MTQPLTAQDLLPLVEKLSRDEQLRLVKLALRAVSGGAVADSDAHRASFPGPGEFEGDEGPLDGRVETSPPTRLGVADTDDAQPFRDMPVTYVAPTDPVASDEWEAAR